MENGTGREALDAAAAQPSHTSHRARLNAWSIAAALAVALVLLLGGGKAWAQAGPSGSVNGLVPRYVEVDGLRTRYYAMGHGEPLVLIHGGRSGGVSNSANVWSKNIRPLSRRFEVFAPDRPGHGLTEGTLAQAKDYEFQVSWLYQFIRTMKLGRVNLVGHSSGGAVAFFFAVAHPEMVKSLVVIAAGPEDPLILAHPQKLDSLLKTCAPATTYDAWKCRVGLLSYAPQIAFGDSFLKAERSMYLWRANSPCAFTLRASGARPGPSSRGVAPTTKRVRRVHADKIRATCPDSGVGKHGDDFSHHARRSHHRQVGGQSDVGSFIDEHGGGTFAGVGRGPLLPPLPQRPAQRRGRRLFADIGPEERKKNRLHPPPLSISIYITRQLAGSPERSVHAV